MLKSSLDESGVGESPYFPRTALVTRAVQGKIGLVWLYLFIEMKNLNRVKEMARRNISENVANLSLFFFFVHIIVCFSSSASF